MKNLYLMLLAVGLLGCAGMSSPSKNLIEQKPVIRAGSTSAANQPDFILMIPAGKTYPLNAHFNSSLIEQKDKMAGKIRLNHDLYVYKKWVSYDGKHWYPLEKFFAISLKPNLNINEGQVNIEVKPLKKAN